MSQLRHSYPEFQARNTEVMEIGPQPPDVAQRAFQIYLRGRELEFPYLCDPEWVVHHLYALQCMPSSVWPPAD